MTMDVLIEEGRYIASEIPEAKLVELPGADPRFWGGDTEPLLEEIEEFITGHRGTGGSREGAGDGSLHRHRRFDQAGGNHWAMRPGVICSTGTMRRFEPSCSDGGEGR